MTPRRRQVALGKITHSETTIKALPDLTAISSFDLPSAPQQQGEVFKYKTPKEIFKYMVASQSRQLKGKTILSVMPNQRMHERNLKLLLKKYDAVVICKAIDKASFYCKHPYTTKIVDYFCRKLVEHG